MSATVEYRCDKISPVWKGKWLVAIRSEKYKQTTSCLRRGGGEAYCCLGVLCDVVGPEGWTEPDTYHYGPQDGTVPARDEVGFTEPPTTVKQLVGLSNGTLCKLIDLNDNKGKNFEEIAQFIDEML